jgi:hypothetical protein
MDFFAERGRKMRVALKVIAWIYVIVGVSSGAKYLHALFFGGAQVDCGSAVLALLLGFGLLRYDPLARGLVLLLSALSLLGGLIGLVLGAGHITGYWTASDGLIVDQPVWAFLLLGVALAFAAGQIWLLTRPEVATLFEKRGAELIAADVTMNVKLRLDDDGG